MDLSKICVGLIVLLAFLGVSSGAETWIKENQTSVGISDLSTTIHIHVKNNKDHVQYFKISQTYKDNLDTPVNWTIDWTDPPASKMVKSTSPELGGDWGWKINPGETKTICFKLSAYGLLGQIPSFIVNKNAQENIYWPLIPEPGMMTSWFQPNEIEMLNPDLDLQFWRGTFTFRITNFDSHSVSGIVRAPIVPMDSKLTYSNPKATFTDKDMVMNGNVAAWDVTIASGASRWFTYVYEWPYGSSEPGAAKASSSVPSTTAAKKTSSVPTKETGVPYGLFIVGGLIAAGGVIYAKFVR